MTIPSQFTLADYRFDLPEENIAQEPAAERDASRLMILDRATGKTEATQFSSILDRLPENALLVANNSRVLPARIFGQKETGGKVEFLLLTPLPLIEEKQEADGWKTAAVEGLLRSSKRNRPGSVIRFDPELELEVVATHDFGRADVRLRWKNDLATLFIRLGHLPLPPYIRRPDSDEDRERYQTTFANRENLGSVAAPTAGLHFTPDLRARLAEAGFGWEEVTLYVGYGTFSPVRCEDIREHSMHREYFSVSERTAAAVREARASGRPVVAVGTTSVRTLEGVCRETGGINAHSGWTDIFIYPGYEFQAVDHMITNFHLPESSLLMMVSAFAGRENIRLAYERAVQEKFRFFSYGDAMLIL